jgi:hypothetical protein
VSVIALVAASLATFFLYMALVPDGRQSVVGRLAETLLAGMFLLLPVRLVWVSFQRKRKWGQWTPTSEERIELRVKWANKPAPRWLRFIPAA